MRSRRYRCVISAVAVLASLAAGGPWAWATTRSGGTQLWVSRYNGANNPTDEACCVVVSSDGSKVFVTGSSTGASSGLDYVTIAYDSANGHELWRTLYNGPANGTDVPRAIAVDSTDSRVVVTGSSDGSTSGDSDWATIAYDPATGAPLWRQRQHGLIVANDDPYALAFSPDG